MLYHFREMLLQWVEEYEFERSTRDRHPEGGVPLDVTVNLTGRQRLNQSPSGILGNGSRGDLKVPLFLLLFLICGAWRRVVVHAKSER